MTRDYDVLIIGARVGGSSLALLLARQGRRVLMVDRDVFPSDTLSTHFMIPPAVGQLAALGVLDDVESAGFRPITRTRTWIEDCLFECPAGPWGSYSLSPRRDVLDSVLLDHAVAAGAELATRTRAESLLRRAGRVTGAVLQAIGGERREVRAAVVVGADGRSSSVAEWVSAGKYLEVRGVRPGYYGYYHGVEPLPEPALEIWFGGDQIGFLFPMRPDEDCIALELQPEDFDTFRSRPLAAFEERVRALPGMERRMRGAVLEGRLQGIRGVDNFFRTPYGPGWALTGDAACLKDPSTGSGIGDALTQSTMLAESLDAWFRGAGWEESLSDYQRRRDAALMPLYEETLRHVELRDQAPRDAAWTKAMLCSPVWLRMLSHALPRLAPQVFPPGALARPAEVAHLFGIPAPEPAPV